MLSPRDALSKSETKARQAGGAGHEGGAAARRCAGAALANTSTGAAMTSERRRFTGMVCGLEDGFRAGGIASVAGFGIGSLLTPLFALRVGTRLAVAAVSVPHVLATALRFWRL